MIVPLLAALVSCLALGLAEGGSSCGPIQKVMVQRQWASLYGTEDDRLKFATQVWRDFFRRNKDEVAHFTRVNGGNIYSNDFRGHMLRVFAGLDIIISSLPDDAVFQSVLSHYKQMHVGKGITKDMVTKFGKSMGYVLPDFLHETFAADAWAPCMKVVAEGIAK